MSFLRKLFGKRKPKVERTSLLEKNVMLCEALGIDTTDSRVESVVLTIQACDLPKLEVVYYVGGDQVRGLKTVCEKYDLRPDLDQLEPQVRELKKELAESGAF